MSRMNQWLRQVCSVMLVGGIAVCGAVADQKPAPENLARRAKVTATAQYSADYQARFVADGVIPEANGHRDLGKAWCIREGTLARGHVDLVFRWDRPIEIAAIVYYGRTAWRTNENMKDYQVFLDGATQALCQGQLKSGHGPQKILIDKGRARRATSLTIRFTSAYGGNPGGSEIKLFAVNPPKAALTKGMVGGATVVPTDSAALARKLASAELGFDRLVVIQRHAINPSHVYTYHAEGLKPGGGLFLYEPVTQGDKKMRRLVDSTEGVVLDCNLSYDGKVVLFSWKKTMRDKFQVYTIGVDGTGLKQITNDDSNNMNACWLPDGGIGFLSDRKPAFAYCWVTTSPILYRCEPDGKEVVRLSSNYLNDFTPAVMQNGKIIYSRWEYVDRPAIPIQGLWTINQDGTGLSGFFGNRVLSPATFMEARQIPGSDKVICVMTSHNGPCRGAIGIIDSAVGANAQGAITNLTPEVNAGLVGRGNGNRVRGPYQSPFPIDQKYFLVSRGGTILLRDYAGTEQTTVLAKDGAMGFYSAQPIRARKRPVVQASTLAKTDQKWATLLLQDVYNGLEPHVQRGQIKKIAVVQEVEKSKRAPKEVRAFGFQFPVVSCGATYAPKKVWGFADVEADGSAHFKAPAGVPIYFMALDDEGRALQRMRSFTHLMPGEKQSCIGCHIDRNHATPINKSRPIAAAKSPQALETPEWGLGGFSYPRVVQPVLDKHCVECHNAREHPMGIDLSADKTDFFNVSYEMLARLGTVNTNHRVGGVRMESKGEGLSPYTRWISTINGAEHNILNVKPKAWGSPASKLADLILSGHPDKDGKKRVQMDAAARRRVFAWIDLNVPYYGTSVSNHNDRVGCRQLLPKDLDATLNRVAKTRCASCHKQVPRAFWTRIENPQLNSFLLAPLAKSAGGTEACGKPVFKSIKDPDYRAILKCFEPIQDLIKRNPRMDMMAGGLP